MSASDSDFEMPQAIDAEKSVLGAILIEGRETFKKIDHILTKDDFYDKDHAIIYRAARAVWQKEGDVDIITLRAFLDVKGYLDQVGNVEGLATLSNYTPSTNSVVQYAKIVADRAVARRIISASAQIMRNAANADDMNVFVEESEKLLKGVTRTAARKEGKLAVVDLEEWREIARTTFPVEGRIRGISTGYQTLDKMTEGFEGGEVMIITGHTKHGKSKLAANIAWNVAEAGTDVMFINTEMTKMQVARRMNGMDERTEATRGKIYLNDRADLEYKDVITIMEHAKELGCGMVIIDHLHFFSRSVENQVNELSKITKEFKEAAVQLDLPVILLCHIQQGDTKKLPTLQSLKGSSSIAQDADLVLAVWRDDRPAAKDPFTTTVVRLAHRSAERAITRIELFADGIRLKEDPVDETPKQAQFMDDVKTIIAEGRDTDDATDLEPDWE